MPSRLARQQQPGRQEAGRAAHRVDGAFDVGVGVGEPGRPAAAEVQRVQRQTARVRLPRHLRGHLDRLGEPAGPALLAPDVEREPGRREAGSRGPLQQVERRRRPAPVLVRQRPVGAVLLHGQPDDRAAAPRQLVHLLRAVDGERAHAQRGGGLDGGARLHRVAERQAGRVRPGLQGQADLLERGDVEAAAGGGERGQQRRVRLGLDGVEDVDVEQGA